MKLATDAETGGRRRAWEDRLAKPMFVLSLLFLIGIAAAIYLTRASEEMRWRWFPVQVVLGGLLLMWPVFVVEAIVRFYLGPPARRDWRSLAVCLAGGLLPPLRMAAHSRTRRDHLWLPWMGWREIDFDLQKTLERSFTGPMLLMALLTLPVLAVEYFWADAVAAYPLLRTVLGVGIGLIWVSFTTEFLIRLSAAEKKIGYAVNHWVDLAVVLVPTLEFLPFLRILRVTRLMRLEKLARIAKYYRLYGLAGKGWRGLVVLRLLQWLWNRSPEARLSRLKGQLEDKHNEIRELEREVDYYRRRIAEVEQELEEEPSGEAAAAAEPPARVR